ncbi:hypothetical protein UFO1_4698 [Pelosinus sp. UFO1]|nr:hypothetical protein UFO1_4698 [Pelosinus sp. UFO1]
MVIVFTLLLCNIAWANSVTVEGNGPTRDDAIRDALRIAVEQAVGALVDSNTISNNNQIISDEIYVHSQGFVQDYHIISEQSNRGSYTVSVNVTVDTEPQSALYNKLQKLKLIEVMLRDPRIAVIIPEFHQASSIANSASETVVIQKLRDAGFKHVIDARQLQHVQENQLVRAILDDDFESAKVLATTEQLDYVIVGEATSQYVGAVYSSSIKSSRAHISAKLLKVDTGEIIAAQGADASGADITPLLSSKKALAASGEKIGSFMVRKLMEYAGDSNKTVTILIKRASFDKISSIQNSLKRISGVQSVTLHSYNSGIAQIDVNYTGAPKLLADGLQQTEGISLDILGITNSSIEVILR